MDYDEYIQSETYILAQAKLDREPQSKIDPDSTPSVINDMAKLREPFEQVLLGNPRITFFKQVYRRHTPFTPLEIPTYNQRSNSHRSLLAENTQPQTDTKATHKHKQNMQETIYPRNSKRSCNKSPGHR